MRAYVKNGLGGCLSLLSFSQLYSKKFPNEIQYLGFITTPKVFHAILDLLYHKTCLASNITIDYYEDHLNDLELAAKSIDKNAFVITPNTFGAARPFDISKTGIRWNQILENRVLQDCFEEPQENNILLALHTSQDNNSYGFSETLVSKLCQIDSHVKVYFPNLKIWAGKDVTVNLANLSSQFSNFIAYDPKSLKNDLLWIGKNIKYCIGIDSGIVNYMYCLGREYIMLDSRYGNQAFQQRWRHQGFRNSIPINTNPTQVAAALKLLIEKPHLSALDKIDLLDL